ncbi:hypothetical protein [Lacinutrix jangbogonensis]|uniref:hypothetical protein n=1 Tax=Lacinutrix jangbogonensis TaxID=1469557 RepID=UPI00068F9613|nr:hypothetical protein [Lacinutrix jangbogonensis]
MADKGCSSGENCAFLEQINLQRFIAPHGTCKGGPDNFYNNESQDHYVCFQGEISPFKKVFKDYRSRTLKKEYRGSTYQCKDYPIKKRYLGKSAKEKKFSYTYFKPEY